MAKEKMTEKVMEEYLLSAKIEIEKTLEKYGVEITKDDHEEGFDISMKLVSNECEFHKSIFIINNGRTWYG